MQFVSLHLTDSGIIMATAIGHPTEVMESFHKVCSFLFYSRGAWRITKVEGTSTPEMNLDSEMKWFLEAELKTKS